MKSATARALTTGLAACVATLAARSGYGAGALTFGLALQDDARTPAAWHVLSAAEQARFDEGYAVFNTEWSPPGSPAGRTDGLGPVMNAAGCDQCHNGRRRGRGLPENGIAPADLVVQLGRLRSDGTVERGIVEYGRVLNTAAIPGFTPEATVSIEMLPETRLLADATAVALQRPLIHVSRLSGAALPEATVLMPRIGPSIQGVGLLERVPQPELEQLAVEERRTGVSGHTGDGRFGWQATEPTVASQTARALSAEMGITSTIRPQPDCGASDTRCRLAPNGGVPEIEPRLFESLLLFEQMHAVMIWKRASTESDGARLFTATGCAVCHRSSLTVMLDGARRQAIHPYTDLLVHEMGEGLADRDLNHLPVRSEWRTAPLWGIGSATVPARPVRYLHDGRARTIEEAILWHGGAATRAASRYSHLSMQEREQLLRFVGDL